jgi:hypothetical protein
MARRKSKYSRIAIVVVALVAVFVLWNLAKRVQVLRSEASIPGNIGEVKAVVAQEEGDLQKVSLFFHTGVEEENSETISYLSFRLELPARGGLVILTDENGLQVSELMIAEEFTDEEHWSVPVNKVYTEEDTLYIDFALVNLTKDGYRSHEQNRFAEFYLKKDLVPAEISLGINKDFSFMYTKDRPVANIWEPPENLVVIR